MVVVVFGILVALIFMLNKHSMKYGRKRRPSNAKKKIYACGEDMSPIQMDVPQGSFYRVFIRYMRLEKLSEWHSGDLSRYLTWVFAGMVVLMLYLLVFWRFV